MSVMANLPCLGALLPDILQAGAFSYHRFIYLLACIDRWKVCNRLVFGCTVKTTIKVERQCNLTIELFS